METFQIITTKSKTPFLVAREEATNFEASSPLSDRTTYQSKKNSNSASSTRNQPSGCVSHTLNTPDLIEKTKKLHSHRSLYPSISDLNSIFDNRKAQHTACQQSSTDKSYDCDFPSRSKCLETQLLGLRRSKQCLLDDNDDFLNEQCYNLFGTSLNFEDIENKLILNEAINFLEKKSGTKRLPSIILLSSRSKYLTDNNDKRWGPSPRRRGGNYLL
jgi:hypothetical protein